MSVLQFSKKRCRECKKLTWHDCDQDCWGPEFAINNFNGVMLQCSGADLREGDFIASYTGRHGCRLDDCRPINEYAVANFGCSLEVLRRNYSSSIFFVWRDRTHIIEEVPV